MGSMAAHTQTKCMPQTNRSRRRNNMAPLSGVCLERCTFLASDEMNSIKYAAYRTAMKLRALQKVTHCKSCEGM